MFPVIGTQTLACDVEMSFTNQPVLNTIIDFGLFLRNGSNPYNPTDGAYFRLTSAGMQGVVNYNGTETNTGVFKQSFGGADWTYTNNKKYQFILYITARRVQFWINDAGDVQLYGEIITPDSQGTLVWRLRYLLVSDMQLLAVQLQVILMLKLLNTMFVKVVVIQ